MKKVICWFLGHEFYLIENGKYARCGRCRRLDRLKPYDSEDQKIIDEIYNMYFDRLYLTAFPPINIKPNLNAQQRITTPICKP